MIFISLPITIAYLYFFGFALGRKFLPHKEPALQLPLGILSLLGLYSLFLSIIFYVYQLTPLIFGIAVAAISAGIIAVTKKHDWRPSLFRPALPSLAALFYYAWLGSSFLILLRSQTTESSMSPWHLVSPLFFITLGASLISLIILLQKGSRLSWLHLSSFVFLVISIANLIYPLGFGFDGFIHRATEQLLLETHTISPKPFAYVGHYALVTLLHLVSRISLETIDRLLPPLVFAFGIMPLAWESWKKYNLSQETLSFWIPLGILILPLSLLVNPTPLALSFAVTIGCIFYGLVVLKKEAPLGPLIILCLFALAVHPLSGIPALILTAFLANSHVIKPRWPLAGNIIMTLIFLGSLAILPAIFILMGAISSNAARVAWFGFDAAILKPFPYINQLNFPLDLAYGAMNAIPLLLLFLLGIGIFRLLKSKESALTPYALTWLALLSNAFLLLTSVRIGNIIAYEQSDFALRIIAISWFTALPVIGYAISPITIIAPWRKIGLISIFAALTLSNIYLAYPRQDEYANQKFTNLAWQDLAAVQNIEERNQKFSYAVLTNQVTSSAAVKEFGLDRTLPAATGERVYFYAIPTGGTLYQFYLRLVGGEDVRSVITEAFRFTQTEKIIVIMPPNWKNFASLSESLAKEAATAYDIDGKLFIFEFSTPAQSH